MQRFKTYYRKGVIVMLFTLSIAHAFAQDIHFSQFYEAPLLRNPSLAGIFTGDIRVQGVYRDQWNSVTTGYRTGSLNAEYKMPVGRGDDFVTMGLQVFYDKAGTVSYTNTQILPALNYHKSMSKTKNMYLSLGFMGGWVQHGIDISKITTNSQFDGMGINENITDPTYTYLDGSVGMSFNAALNNDPRDNYYLGAAYHHFNRPNNSFYKNKAIELNPKWVFSGGLRFGVSEQTFVTIQADHSKQGPFTETIFGGMYGILIGGDADAPDYAVHLGTFMRLNDALIPAIKLDYHPFSVTFSYDANVSKLKPSSYGRGGFELSVTFIKNVERHGGELLCPRF